VPGAILLDTLLQRVKASELVLCEWALREGLLGDYVAGHASYLAAVEMEPDLRRRSVIALAERCRYDAAHARQVADVALALFDKREAGALLSSKGGASDAGRTYRGKAAGIPGTRQGGFE
jgi:exopolyphosphatase/guanosine-5'-triphosphate,3'-diphosphate pyrophosphatase